MNQNQPRNLPLVEQSNRLSPAHDPSIPDIPDKLDPATQLYLQRREALSNSRWREHFSGLNESQALAMHERIEELQRLRPLSGYALVGRIRGVKCAIMLKRYGDSRWGKSMLCTRGPKKRSAYWAARIQAYKDGQLP